MANSKSNTQVFDSFSGISDPELKELLSKLKKALDAPGAYIEDVQPFVWEIKEIARKGKDITPALIVLSEANNKHLCEHGCPIEATVSEALCYHYARIKNKEKLRELINESSSRGAKLGAIRALEKMFSEDVELLLLVVKKLADEDDIVRVDTSTILEIFVSKNKNNAKLVLDQITKSGVDKTAYEVKLVIDACNSIMKK